MIKHYYLVLLLVISVFSCSQPSVGEAFTRLTDLEGDEDQIAWSPDGKRIAFTSFRDGDSDIYVVNIDGGALRQIGESQSRESGPAWSPDGKQLAYAVQENDLEYINLHDLNSDEVNRVELPDVHLFRSAWSPDGESLVFNGDDGASIDIYLYSLESERFEKLTDELDSEYHFGFSPDGQYIGYNKRGGAHEDLFAISIDGEEKINITQHPDHEWYPQWSQQGDKVLFYSTWGEMMTEVWTVAFPEGDLTQISDHIVEDYGPDFSPDGNEVVFISKRDGYNDLYIYRFDDQRTRRLNIAAQLKEGWPKWSPEGNSLAYSTNLEEPYLYQLTIATGEVKRLTGVDQKETYPAANNSGEYVALVSTGGGSESNILLYETATHQVNPILDTYHYQTRPQFSNRTGMLGFIQSSGGSVATNDVFAISLDKKDSIRITHSGGVRHFIWSADDQEIIYAYDSSANYSYDLWKLHIASGKKTPLLMSAESEIPTSVSPDGKDLLFYQENGGKKRLYRMPVSGGKAEPIIHELETGWDARYSPDGKQIVFVSDQNGTSSVDLYLMNREGGEAQRLTFDQYKESNPIWTHDAGSIIFSAQKGNKDIWLYRLF